MGGEMIPLEDVMSGKLNPVIAARLYDEHDLSGLSDIRLKLMVIINQLEKKLRQIEELTDIAIETGDIKGATKLYKLQIEFMKEVKNTLVPLKDDLIVEVRNLGGIKVTSNSDDAFVRLCERWALYLKRLEHKYGPAVLDLWSEIMEGEEPNISKMLIEMYEDVDYTITDIGDVDARRKTFENSVNEILSSHKSTEDDTVED